MDCFISTILPWPGTYAPYGFNFCNGTTFTVSQYNAVYALIGTLYGGTANVNFSIPNLKGRVPIGNDFATTRYQLAATPGNETTTLSIANLAPHFHAAQFTATVTPQTITIPATPGSGSITATATTDVVPGQTGTMDPVNGDTYYLTGVNPANGPFTKTATPGPGNTATLIGTKVVVDASTYKPTIPQSSFSINMVSGGNIVVGNTGSATPFSNIQPSLVLNFIFALSGLWPQRD